MTKEEIKIILTFLKDFYNRTDIKAFRDCVKVMNCDLKIELKRIEQEVKKDAR